MGFWSLARGLRRRQQHFFDRLERQAAIASEAAATLATFERGANIGEIRERAQAHERLGHGLVGEIEATLAKAYITPIDREDIYELALQLDGVIDSIHRCASRCELMGLAAPPPAMTAMVGVLVETTAVVAKAVSLLRRRDYVGILAAKDDVARLAKAGSRAYDAGVRGIFLPEGADVTTLLRDRELLDDLDSALEHCGLVVQTLATLAVKHR